MARSFKDQVARLNKELNDDLAKMEVKQRVTFHMGGQVHEKSVTAKNRCDRRSVKRDLRRGDWS